MNKEERAEQIYRGNTIEEEAYKNGWADGVQEMQSALSYKFHEILNAYDKVQKENIKNNCFSESIKDKMETIAWAIRQIENYGL